jgi:hypothetical protein
MGIVIRLAMRLIPYFGILGVKSYQVDIGLQHDNYNCELKNSKKA